MKPLASLALVLLLGACAPLSIYYKPGVSVARLETDLTGCQVKALRDAPVATQIRQSPPVFYPGRVYCDGAGQCWRGAPYWVEGSIYSVDVNAGLRERVTDQCMATQGYQPVQVPNCPAGLAVPPGRTEVLPKLGPNSCAVKQSDGSFLIVDLK